MVNETDQIVPDELLLRRIPNSPDYINPALEQPVSRLAFRPTNADSDGLSVFRALFSTPENVSESGRNPNEVWVATIAARAIIELKLSVIPSPTPEGPRGHSLIPEICYAAKETTRVQQLELARLASKNYVFVTKKKSY